MTTVMSRPGNSVQWNGMPGWDIVGDLTPPELINLRRLKALRKQLLVGLLIVVLLCIAGYGFASYRHGQAADAATNASNQTSTLQEQVNRYSAVPQIKNLIASTDHQVSQLLTDDVDVARLSGQIRDALPASMSIQSMSITFTGGPTSTSGTNSSSSSNGSTSLDTSGRPEIGTITLSGSARSITDLPTFVDQLSVIPGIVNVLPQSDQAGTSKGASAQYSVSAAMTDKLFSRYFAHGPTGGK